MNQVDIIQRFHAALPAVRKWIEKRLERSASHAQLVSASGFQRLADHFPVELLARAKYVTVPSIPFPPLSQMGLPELAAMEQLPLAGITFTDTFFVQSSQQRESLFVHELVHVIQWERLGMDRFLLAYGVGLTQFGYEGSPLEQMAYSIQRQFENGGMPPDVVTLVNRRTDAIWEQVAPIIDM